MARKAIHLSSEGVRVEGGWFALAWNVTQPDGANFVLSHSMPEGGMLRFGDPERGDHALIAVLLSAMRQGADIVVEGRVSPRLLDGIETLQSIWHCWRPHLYRVVDIRVDEECEARSKDPADASAIFAFSGGVDASYSLFRHLQNCAGRHNRNPQSALLIHGMDIPIGADAIFNGAALRAETMLGDTGLPLVRMRTNSRGIEQDWEDSHGLQLSACFMTLQESFRYAVIATSDRYDSLTLPWGSTPLTDPLASTAALTIEHDGCEVDRTEKVRWLSTRTHICSHLRVCWAGNSLDRNCGECEKCLRTMLNFWAVGIPVPAAFPTQLTPERVLSIRASEAQMMELEHLLTHALRHHSPDDPILKSLRRLLGHTGFTRLPLAAGRMVRRVLGF